MDDLTGFTGLSPYSCDLVLKIFIVQSIIKLVPCQVYIPLRQCRYGSEKERTAFRYSYINQIISPQLSRVRLGIMCNINCLPKQMKCILRKWSLLAPAPSHRYTLSTTVKSQWRAASRDYGMQDVCFYKGNERCLNKAI